MKLLSRWAVTGIANGLRLLTPGESRLAPLVLLSILTNALLQTVALAGVVPFIQILVEPERALSANWARWLGSYGVSQDPYALLMVIGLLLLLAVGTKTVFAWYNTSWQASFSARCEARLASQLFSQVILAPYSWAAARNSVVVCDVILGHVGQWSRGFLRGALQVANDLLFFVFVVVVLVVASPLAGLVVCALGIVVGVFLFRWSRPVVLAKAKIKQSSIREAALVCSQGISGLKDVKMTGSAKFFEREFAESFGRYSSADAAAANWKSAPRLGIELIGYCMLVATALVVLSTEQGRGETTALLALYALATLRMMPVLSNIVTALGTLVDTLPFIEELSAMLAETTNPEAHGLTEAGPGFGDWSLIEFRGVEFGYPGSERPALTGIDLRLERGGAYGVVGPSGAGKSTLIDLLSGLIDVNEGEILISGRRLDKSNILEWRSRIGYVSQQPFILDASLRENISFGIASEDVDQERLRRAVSGAQLDDLVYSQLPEGLDTRLGEHGVRLSGGQRQRVAIARALYRRVELLIFDEATSALDSLSEREISQEIEALAGSVTVLLIAHRLGTVRRCREIVVLAEGRIAGLGSHEDLAQGCALYSALLEAQLERNREAHT